MTGHARAKRPASCTCRRDVGLLLMRLGIGAVLMAHGGQKLFGLFGGGGIEGTAAAMESMGFEPGRESALAAGVGETGGGALLALGLATPAAGAAAAGTMAAAAAVNWEKGLFAMRGGYELPLLIGLGAAGLGLTGAGTLSLDDATGHLLDRPWLAAAAFVGTAGVAAAVINRRNGVLDRRAEAEARAEAESEPASQPDA
ncbi:DoxX family protein [Actinospica sp.]|uniref:DoxX family protein n=1 Tax=Actinospica sp. TaxID=1872142 RepID=UPI002B9E8ED7|nr:DoxX family protein [Actinospica sp.]HWG27773.1 DoxX family protein [Actinospica sp.]